MASATLDNTTGFMFALLCMNCDTCPEAGCRGVGITTPVRAHTHTPLRGRLQQENVWLMCFFSGCLADHSNPKYVSSALHAELTLAYTIPGIYFYKYYFSLEQPTLRAFRCSFPHDVRLLPRYRPTTVPLPSHYPLGTLPLPFRHPPATLLSTPMYPTPRP